MDLSVTQDIFNDIGGKRHAFQFRVDFLNFGNLLNSDWGVGQRLVRISRSRPTAAQGGAVDACGPRAVPPAGHQQRVDEHSLEQTADLGDVYKVMFRLQVLLQLEALVTASGQAPRRAGGMRGRVQAGPPLSCITLPQETFP